MVYRPAKIEGGGGRVEGGTLSAYLATAYLGDDDLYWQTDTGILVRTHFWLTLAVQLRPWRERPAAGEPVLVGEKWHLFTFFLPSRPGATLSCTRRPRVTLTAARRPTATLASTDRPAAGDPDRRPPPNRDPGRRPPSNSDPDRRPPPKSDPVLWRPKGWPPEHTSKISPQHTSMVRLASQGPSLCKAPVSRPYTGPASKVLANGHPGLSTAPPAARTKRRPFTARALRVTLAVASACVRRKGATGDPALSLARPPTVWPSRPWLASSASPASQQHAQNRPPAC